MGSCLRRGRQRTASAARSFEGVPSCSRTMAARHSRATSSLLLLLCVAACSPFTLPRMTLPEHGAEPLFAKSLQLLRGLGVETPLTSSFALPKKEEKKSEETEETVTGYAARAGASQEEDADEDDVLAAGLRLWTRTQRWLSRHLGSVAKYLPGPPSPSSSSSAASNDAAEDPAEAASNAVYLAREAAAAGHPGAIVLLAHLRLFGPRASVPASLLASPAFEPIVLNRTALPAHDTRRQCIGVGAAPGTFFDAHWDALDMDRMPIPDPLFPALPADAPHEGALARQDAVFLRYDAESDAIQALAFAACLTHIQLSALLLHSMAVCPTTRNTGSLHAAVLARSPLLAWVSDADLAATYGLEVAARIRADAAGFASSKWRALAEADPSASAWVGVSAGDINVAWRGSPPHSHVAVGGAALPPEVFFENHADFPHHITAVNSRNIEAYNGVEALSEDTPLTAHVNPLAWLPQNGAAAGAGSGEDDDAPLDDAELAELQEALAELHSNAADIEAELGLPPGSLDVEGMVAEELAAELLDGEEGGNGGEGGDNGRMEEAGIAPDAGFFFEPVLPRQAPSRHYMTGMADFEEGDYQYDGSGADDLPTQQQPQRRDGVAETTQAKARPSLPAAASRAPSPVSPATAALRKASGGVPSYVGGMLANVLRSDVAAPWMTTINTYEQATLTLAMLHLARVRVGPDAVLRFRGAAAAASAPAPAASTSAFPLPPAWPIFPTDQAAIDVLDLLAHRRLEIAQVVMAHRHLHGMGGSSLAGRADEDEPEGACAKAVDYLLPVAMHTVADASVSAAAPPETAIAQLWEAHEDAQVLAMAGEEERNVDFIRQQALEEGNPEAQFQWANMILYGHPAAGVRADPEGAAALLREVADVHGNAEARAQLGLLMIDRGMNGTEAVEHLERAAADGSPQAWAGLGYVYEAGAGNVTRNLTKAVEYLEKAAAYGYSNAHANLGALYLMGTPPPAVEEGEEPPPPPPLPPDVDPSTVVPFNATAAKHHLTYAASAGFVPAYYNLALIDYYGWDNPTRTPNCTAAALHWKQCGDRGAWNVHSPFTLASAFEEFSFAKTGRLATGEPGVGTAALSSNGQAEGSLGEAAHREQSDDGGDSALTTVVALLRSAVPAPLVTGWHAVTSWAGSWLPGQADESDAASAAAAGAPPHAAAAALHLELAAPDAARSALLQYLMLQLVGIGSAADNAGFLLDAGVGHDLVDVVALGAGPFNVVGTPGVGLPHQTAEAPPAVTDGDAHNGEQHQQEEEAAVTDAPASAPAAVDTSPATRLATLAQVPPPVVYDLVDRGLAAREGADRSLAAAFLTLVGAWAGGSNYGSASLVTGQPRLGANPWSAWHPTFPLPLGPRQLSFVLYATGAEMRVSHSTGRLGDCYADGWAGVPPCAQLPATGSLTEAPAREAAFGTAETEESAPLVAALAAAAFGKWLPRASVAGLDRSMRLTPLSPWPLANRTWAALYWYTKASDGGSPHAMMTLSRGLSSGRLGQPAAPLSLPQSSEASLALPPPAPLLVAHNFSRAWELLDQLVVADPMLSEWPVMLARGATGWEWAVSAVRQLLGGKSTSDADDATAGGATAPLSALAADLWGCFCYMPPLPGNTTGLLDDVLSESSHFMKSLSLDDLPPDAADEAALLEEEQRLAAAAAEAAQLRLTAPRHRVGPFPLTVDDRRLCSITVRVLVGGGLLLAVAGAWLLCLLAGSGRQRRAA